MNLIIFTLEKAGSPATQTPGRRSDALDDIPNIFTRILKDGSTEYALLVHDSSELPNLGRAISIADNRRLPYKMIVVESASEWGRPFDKIEIPSKP